LFGDAQAQRYLPRQRGIQFTFGTVNGLNINTKSDDFAFHAGVAFSSYTKKSNRWIFGGEYLEKRYLYENMRLPAAQFTIEGGYYLNFLSNGGKTFFFSFGPSAMAGYETINWNNKLLPDGATILNGDTFLYGAALTFEIETYITDWLVLLITARERFLPGSSVGKFNTQLGLGIKFIIY